jgi:hypothetical protein
MNEYAQAIFEEAGHNLDRAIELLNSRTCDQLICAHRRWAETVAVHSRTLRALVSLDAEHALANFPGIRRHPLQGRADLRELVRSMK